MADAQVMDLTVVARSFPESIATGDSPRIPRDNVLDSIETIFQGGTQLVIIEGPENIGKTTLLAQFTERHPCNAISLFVGPTSRWAYDPDQILLDLSNQINWILSREELADPSGVDIALLRSLLFKLRGYARRKRETFYFVVDGLDQIPKEAIHNRKVILDMLPLDGSGFRFLFTGDAANIMRDVSQKVVHKPSTLFGFNFDETTHYLAGLSLSEDALEDIHKICRGNPGHLASVRRNLLAGIKEGLPEHELLGRLPQTQPELFELEWQKVDAADQVQLDLLAILAHDLRAYTLDTLAHLLGVDTTILTRIIDDLGFVLTEAHTHEVHFVSNTFRRYAAQRLSDRIRRATDLVVTELLNTPESSEALTYLPTYLERAGRPEAALDYLSPLNFSHMLDISRTLAPAQQRAEQGVRLARELRRDGDLLRLSLHSAAFTELCGPEVLRSEIAARMSMGDYDAALLLAQGATLKEDQLQMLGVIARARRERGLPPQPDVIEQIRELYTQINFASVGSRSIEIATDLIYSVPDLAVEVVEKANTTASGENTLDWAFTMLSLTALAADAQDDPTQAPGVFEELQARVGDANLRDFLSATSLLLKGYSADELIAKTRHIEGASNQLFLMRVWAMVNRRRSDAADLVEHALTMAIQTTEYAPNARTIRELTAPLPFVNDPVRLKQLVVMFDAQKSTVESRGPTEEFLRIQMLLAHAEMRYDAEAARNRLIDVYLYIDGVTDLVIRSASLARLMVTLSTVDPQLKFETKEGLHTLTENDLDTNLKQLLADTAYHHDAARGVIRALAQMKPDLALQWVHALNTEAQRDQALLDLIDAIISGSPGELNLAFLGKAMGCFAVAILRDIALLKILENLPTPADNSDPVIKDTLPLIGRIRDIQDAAERCRACSLAYGFMMDGDPASYVGLANDLLAQMGASWECIDTGWEKVNVGFSLAQALAGYSDELARSYLERTERCRDDILLTARNNAAAYSASVRLAIRAYSGLLPSKVATDADLDRLGTLIDRIPASGERAILWSELAVRCHAKGQQNECSRIVTEHVKPLLERISDKDARHRCEIIAWVAPALYCAHSTSALEIIAGLPQNPQPFRDEAYGQISRYILTKQPRLDPYEVIAEQAFDMSFENLVDLCKLIGLMDRDWLIYGYMVPIVNTMVDRRNTTRFSANQRVDIARRLEEIINTKLPNQRHTKHQGYKIAAQAEVARLKGASAQDWENLVNAAKAIGNASDKSLLLSMIGSAMPSNNRSRESVFEEAKKVIEYIPTDLDRMGRYESLAFIVADIFPAIAKDCLRSAMKICLRIDSPRTEIEQRRIIDMAYRVDADLAGSLASLADDDPARLLAKLGMKHRIQVLELRQRLLGQGSQTTGRASHSDYPEAATMLLSSLNAGRIQHVHIEDTREAIQVASALSLEQAYPVFSWVLENANSRYERDMQRTSGILRPLFEATLAGVELTGGIAAHSSLQIGQSMRQAVKSAQSTRVMIEAGEREKALAFLREWLTANVQGYLKICDPYFGPDELELLHLVLATVPKCRVQILTGKKHHVHEKIEEPWEDAYRNRWRHISDQEPPYTDITIVGTATKGEPPIHDRWWLTKDAGLSLGTSFNSLGGSKISGINRMSAAEAEENERIIDQYLQRTVWEHYGEPLRFQVFTL